MQLLEDVGIVGKGVLIMSGHDDEFHPNNILPSPAFTTSTQGTIPSAPMTPNSTRGVESGTRGSGTEGGEGSGGTINQTNSTNEGATKSPNPPIIQDTPSSTPGSPPSSPNVQAPSPAPMDVSSSALPPGAATSESVVSKSSSSPNPALAALNAAPIVPPSTNKKRSLTPNRKGSRFGSPSSTVRQASVLHITNIQEASQAVAESKYHETFSVLEVNHNIYSTKLVILCNLLHFINVINIIVRY